jgi:ketopantoate reductase
MKILIVGAGIIGAIYGWALSEGENEVVHFVRPGKAARFSSGIRMDVLDNRKGKKQFIGGYALQVTETLAAADGCELVIVPTKPYQLEKVLGQIVPRIGPADYLLLTQNWQGTAKIDECLPRSRYAYGDAKAGGAFRDGTLISALFPTIDLGQVDGRREDWLKKTAALFGDVGIQPVLQENILHYIWVQYAINAGLWTGVVRAGGLDPLLKDSRTGEKSLRAVKECLDVVARRGVDVKKYGEARMYLNTSFMRPRIMSWMLRFLFYFNKSVYRTSLHALGDPREITTSYYDLLNTGRELGVPMPVMTSFENDMLRFAGSKNE